MRRFTTFLTLFGISIVGIGCQSNPINTTRTFPNHIPGDFRVGVVVFSGDHGSSQDLVGGDARYIIDSSSVLRASFGAGSSLATYPGFTRLLTKPQMEAVWLMTRNLLEHNIHDSQLSAGQPQSMLDQQSGTIIEIHLNARDQIFVFGPENQHAAAIVDALSTLAWVDTTPATLPQP